MFGNALLSGADEYCIYYNDQGTVLHYMYVVAIKF